ncbi:acylphosphatase [Thermoplasmatales archaeon SW_10_69_26]|nr:MAG: acylphosphatase [Thermoplasmatales archaeon SW_10_69_26]
MTVTKHVFVTGKVQGVYFRDTTRKTAAKHGVDGWVRNLPDGRVEAVFQGEPDAVDAMVEFCHEGSSAARVDSVEVEPAEDLGTFDTFEVRPTPAEGGGPSPTG